MKKQDQKLSQTMEDYLETIFVLSKSKGYARTGEISKELNVSPSSVVEMIGKISKLGFSTWKRYEGVYLTDEGKMRGEIIHIRHVTLRRFFEFIGVDPVVANKEACIIEHELSPVTTTAIRNLVAFLQTTAGSQTVSALECFLKFQEFGLMYEGPVTIPEQEDTPILVSPAMNSSANRDILSVISRHDLMNTIASLNRYLDLLKSLSTGEEMNLVISRIYTTIQAVNTQLEAGSGFPMPTQSGHQWVNVGRILNACVSPIPSGCRSYDQNLDSIEIKGDWLLEKGFKTIIRQGVMQNREGSDMASSYCLQEGVMTMSIQFDTYCTPVHENQDAIKPWPIDNTDTDLFTSDQILRTYGIQIQRRETQRGVCIMIIIPNGSYRIKEKEVSSQVIVPEPCSVKSHDHMVMTRAS